MTREAMAPLGRVLDVGAGAGKHSGILRRRGMAVCALDVCPEAVEKHQMRSISPIKSVTGKWGDTLGSAAFGSKNPRGSRGGERISM